MTDITDLPGPRATTSLRERGSPLRKASVQMDHLHAIHLPQTFGGLLRAHGLAELRRSRLEIFQMNLGRLCNMSCRHCHVDAGPDRHDEVMTWETMEAALDVLDRTDAHTADLTGGAPELNPHFKDLVEVLLERKKHVVDRCNLSVLLLEPLRDLPEWLAERGVEIVCSLPHYRARNTQALRGSGSFAISLEAMKRLNEVGYGKGDPERILTVMANPAGAYLAGDQESLFREFRASLERDHGVTFDRLIALNNMPIGRYLEWLESSGNLEPYLMMLLERFNPGTVSGLMCRNTLSISWQGLCYDCDFNQMLEIPLIDGDRKPLTVRDLDPGDLANRIIRVARHCLGCTAGAGSSCAGATA